MSTEMLPAQDLLKAITGVRELVEDDQKTRAEKQLELEAWQAEISDKLRKVETRVETSAVPGADPEILRFAQDEEDLAQRMALLLSHKPIGNSNTQDQIREAQRLSDDVYLARLVCKTFKIGGDLRQTDLWKRHRASIDGLVRNWATTVAGLGQEWTFEGFSNEIMTQYRLMLRVAALFQGFPIPQGVGVFRWPYSTQRPTAQVAPQTTGLTHGLQNLGTKRMFSDTTKNRDFDPPTLRALEIFSHEVGADAVAATIPWLRDEIAFALADGRELTTVSGDDTATHMDDGVAAPDPRTMLKGLRKLALDKSSTKDFSGNVVDTKNLRGLRNSMGAYGVNPRECAWVVPLTVLFQMMNLDEVITLDKYGPNATVLAGELANFDGSPVIPSEAWPAAVNSSGVVDATPGNNDKQALIYANRTRLLYGNKDGYGAGVEEMALPPDGVTILVAFDRFDFKSLAADADKNIAYGINIKNDVT